jgi:hypothetical protein
MDVLRDPVERLRFRIDGEEVGNLVRHTDNVGGIHGCNSVMIVPLERKAAP